MTSEKRGFEQADDVVPSRAILRVIAGVLLVGTVLSFVAYGVLRERESALRPSHRFPERNFPAPDRQGSLQSELFDLSDGRITLPALQRESLSSYRYLDKRSGIVQIPVEEAMKALLRSRP